MFLKPVAMSLRLLDLGKKQGQAGAAFLADPSPINRAAYMQAIRQCANEAYKGQPKAIRFLMERYTEMLNEIEEDHNSVPGSEPEAA